MGRLYLGLDSSTQSLTATVIDVTGTTARVIFETSLAFDEALPQYGTQHGVLVSANPAIKHSSPQMWADALDMMFARLAASGIDMSSLAALSGSAQQHGSVYLSRDGAATWNHLDASQPPGEQITPLLSRPTSPIWMDSSTGPECAAITGAVGGAGTLAEHTGSRAFERFTGPQIRRFAEDSPDDYARTRRIHVVSSFLASVLVGHDAPVDPGDASGMNLMDLRSKSWWSDAVTATAPDLDKKLPVIADSWTVAGSLSGYWRTRHHLPAARVITWSGDNPCSLIGVGLVREGQIAVSLGTSDTIFGLMKAPRVDPGGTGHVFGAPTGDYMGLTCFSNGSLAREAVRDAFRMTWADFSKALDATPPGNDGRVMLPWFAPEITPTVSSPGVHRFRLAPDDASASVRAVVEAQQMAMALHSRWMSVTVSTIHATGGAAVNRQILQVMANVFGADVYHSTVTNSAALGAALRAWHADALANGAPLSWDVVSGGLEQPDAVRIAPESAHHATYRTLMPIYEACERHALAGGKDPTFALEAFALSMQRGRK
jgi:xylulokinase